MPVALGVVVLPGVVGVVIGAEVDAGGAVVVASDVLGVVAVSVVVVVSLSHPNDANAKGIANKRVTMRMGVSF